MQLERKMRSRYRALMNGGSIRAGSAIREDSAAGRGRQCRTQPSSGCHRSTALSTPKVDL